MQKTIDTNTATQKIAFPNIQQEEATLSKQAIVVPRSLTYDDVQIIPQYSEILSRSAIKTQSRFTRNFNIDLPIVSAPMNTVTESEMSVALWELGGVGILHRFMSMEAQAEEVKKVKAAIAKQLAQKNGEGQAQMATIPIAACTGATGDFLERAEALAAAGANVILIDIAHGHHVLMKKAIAAIKSALSVDVIAGNVATSRGAMDLVDWGADAIRVGIGNGSLCETRIRTGVGVPQVTALLQCIAATANSNIPIIADGGVQLIGDVCKAMGLGASSVMIGSLLSGTKESPGMISKVGVWPNEKLYKKYQGSASLSAKTERGDAGKHVEGNSKLVPYKGKTKRIIGDIKDGMRSSMSYVGAVNMSEFWRKAQFTVVTQSGIREAYPHLLLS